MKTRTRPATRRTSHPAIVRRIGRRGRRRFRGGDRRCRVPVFARGGRRNLGRCRDGVGVRPLVPRGLVGRRSGAEHRLDLRRLGRSLRVAGHRGDVRRGLGRGGHRGRRCAGHGRLGAHARRELAAVGGVSHGLGRRCADRRPTGGARVGRGRRAHGSRRGRCQEWEAAARDEESGDRERRNRDPERLHEREPWPTNAGEAPAPAARPQSCGVGIGEAEVTGSETCGHRRQCRGGCRQRAQVGKEGGTLATLGRQALDARALRWSEVVRGELRDRERIVLGVQWCAVGHGFQDGLIPGTVPCGARGARAARAGRGGCGISLSQARRRSSRRSRRSRIPRRRTARSRSAGPRRWS